MSVGSGSILVVSRHGERVQLGLEKQEMAKIGMTWDCVR